MDTTSALTLAFPDDTHQKINEIRSKYDKAYPRWMPHINFIFPFVPVDKFDEIANRLSCLNNFGGFELELNTIGYFIQGSNVTFHAKPDNDSKLQNLFKLITEVLPEIESKREQFHPHLTLAQFPRLEIDIRKQELIQWLGSGIKIKVDRIHLIKRDGADTPFKIVKEVLLYISNPQPNPGIIGRTRSIPKSVEKIKFADAELAVFVDNSGSTAGKILATEIDLAKKLLKPVNIVDKLVLWNTTVTVKPTNAKSEGGTTPQCIFNNEYSKQLFANSEIVVFMTDGEIGSSDVVDFSNKLKNYLNKSLFVCVFVSSGITDFTKLNVSVLTPMMIGPNVLCLYLDMSQQNKGWIWSSQSQVRILASKGEISRKYPGPNKLLLSEMPLIDIGKLLETEISKTNIPPNCLVVDETAENYIIIDMNEIMASDLLLDLNVKAWEVLIKHAAVSNTLEKIRSLISKSRNTEILAEKQKCKSEFQFNYITRKDNLTNEMTKAFLEGDVDFQLRCKLVLDSIKDAARLEELAYSEFVKKRLDVIRGKWDSIRNMLANFENTDSRFSLNNFAFGSNRANRAKTIDDDLLELNDNLDFTGSSEIDCIVHMDKGPAVLWLNQFTDTDYSTSDFCINFPLASFPDLQKTIVHNPVCGDCASHYMKYSQTSVYREPVTGFIPTIWNKSNINYANNVLCKIYCGQKQLHHAKLLLMSVLDDSRHNLMEFRDPMLKSMIENVYTNDTLSEEGTKMPFIEMLKKIINNEECLLRQPWSACVRILGFCHKFIETDSDIIISWIRRRFAYLLIEIHSSNTKKSSIESVRKELECMCFDTFCGIPLEDSIKKFISNSKEFVSFVGTCNNTFLERICQIINMDKNEIINNNVILNILWHLQTLECHERPWTVYTNLMQKQKLFRCIGSEPNNFPEIINNAKFGRYKKSDDVIIPLYAFYNGEFSGPSKFYFLDQPLWSNNLVGKEIRIQTLAEDLKTNIQKIMSNKFGSYYPNDRSAHTALHRTVAKILESEQFKNSVMNDEMIYACLEALAETDGNYGNIYRPELLFIVVMTVEFFYELRSKSVNRATGNQNIDKTFEHKVKCELLESSMEINGDIILFNPDKLIKPKYINVNDINIDMPMRNRVEQIYFSKKFQENIVINLQKEKVVSYNLIDPIVIGKKDMDIGDCLPFWEREQKELIGKIKLTGNLDNIKYIGGADISWDKNETDAVACMVVHNYETLEQVAIFTVKCQVYIPYKAGYLAFREVPIYLKLIDAIYQNYPEFIPNVILVDGNGVWHPRGCGAASHLSILSGIPTIGVSKNVLFADGIGRDEVQNLLADNAPNKDDCVEIIGNSGTMIGYAYNSTGSIKKAIYVSAGNGISQKQSMEIIRHVNKYRISETIRQADKLSRMMLAE